MKLVVIAVLAAFLGCGAAAAQSPGESAPVPKPAPKKAKPKRAPKPFQGRWYAGAGLGHCTFSDWSSAESANDGSYTSVGGDDADSGYQVFAGVEFRKHHAFELAFANLGSASYTARSDGSGTVWSAGAVRDRVSVEGLALTWQAGLPVSSRTLLFARFGTLRWTSESLYTGTTQVGPVRYRDHGAHWDLLFGGGVAFDPSPIWRLRASYVRYALTDPARVERDAVLGSFELTAAYRF